MSLIMLEFLNTKGLHYCGKTDLHFYLSTISVYQCINSSFYSFKSPIPPYITISLLYSFYIFELLQKSLQDICTPGEKIGISHMNNSDLLLCPVFKPLARKETRFLYYTGKKKPIDIFADLMHPGHDKLSIFTDMSSLQCGIYKIRHHRVSFSKRTL